MRPSARRFFSWGFPFPAPLWHDAQDEPHPVVVNVLQLAVMFERFETGEESGAALLLGAVSIGIRALLSYLIFVGRNWARHTLCPLIVVGSIPMMFTWKLLLTHPPVTVWMNWGVTVAEWTAVILLFTVPARRWFTQRRQAA